MTTATPDRNETRSPATGATSHGRGGAGNISSAPTVPVGANDLSTPTIKNAHYTTGRGGSGNMATNDPTKPGVARAAQDVEAPAHHEKERQGAFHWGRGGEGNLMTVGGKKREGGGGNGSGSEAEGKAKAKARSRSREVAAGKVSGEEKRDELHCGAAKEGRAALADQPRRSSFKGAVQKGKELLGLGGEGGKKGGEKAGESAAVASDSAVEG